ncbi:uncharacterized protein J7T54_004190 [Emericellopsis cladophorae]|uniref:Saccharopine dehydrogenase NADP binding domain-containing protein n=1 Tax=Emericellopsis cladophorae TaxID=2686198 RepID=A0A9P9XVB2_9HYPO|nr:uncharacterized protein J7T54_004190 [Emericellopsis cladophorae]KAI6778283.1 hypothetical protein J7T54_004190 [Emericellopsis cladophorae]
MLLIYGATGYTGRLASRHAKQLSLDFTIAGRTSSIKTREFASELDVSYRLFDADQSDDIDASLDGISVLLNCAGPFFRTAGPLISACMRNGVHYLDIAAELDSYRLAERHDGEAKTVGVMLLPGCGGSVAMLGCLAAHALDHVKKPTRIDISICVTGAISRGSAISASENMTAECLQRLDGELVKAETSNTIQLDFDNSHGNVTNYPVTLPDLITIWKSTGVRNIRTFIHVAGEAFSRGDLSKLPDGPTQKQREETPYHAAVEVVGENETVARAVLHTVNGYTFTGVASVEAAKRVLAGSAKAGFQTPADIFGKNFLDAIPGTQIKDM